MPACYNAMKCSFTCKQTADNGSVPRWLHISAVARHLGPSADSRSRVLSAEMGMSDDGRCLHEVLVCKSGSYASPCVLIRKRKGLQTSGSAHKHVPNVRIGTQPRAIHPDWHTTLPQTSGWAHKQPRRRLIRDRLRADPEATPALACRSGNNDSPCVLIRKRGGLQISG